MKLHCVPRVGRAVLAIAIAAILAPVVTALAQAGAGVTGTLKNALSGDVVAGATVTLVETGAVATSDAEGRYALAGVPVGEYQLRVAADGYLPKTQDFRMREAALTLDLDVMPEIHYSDVVSVTPQGRSQFDSFQATDVLAGQDLAKVLQTTLGATIESQPGIALRSFGPGPARPVIRGLDGDRVLIVEDGLRTGDLSSQSGDHGVNVNPASAQSIEVVRGPATLLYGANAIGGLVNVITNDIPTAPVTRPTGSFTLDAGSAAPGGGGAGDVTVGNGAFALHVSGSGRRTTDFETPEGAVDNSFSRSGAAEIGASYTSPRGYFGGSYAYDRTHYGIPFVEKGETSLDPRRQNITLRGESREMGGLFDGLRGSFAVRRYKHDELDGDVVATSFVNNTTELELLGHHRPAGKLTGSVGGSFLTRDFSAAGEEALSPRVTQRVGAAYVYEEVDVSPHVQMQFGGRVDHTALEPQDSDEPARSFTNLSGSVGLLLQPSDRVSAAFSLARASRSPALEELYFHGPHAGNAAIENGDPNLVSEHSIGFDASIRLRGEAASGEVTFFMSRFDNFIFREYTGAVDDEEGLADTIFTQGDGRMVGVESHIDVRVGPLVVVEGGLDYVRGELTALAAPMPRMPPLRGRMGLHVQRNAFQAGIDGTFTASQTRVQTVEIDGERVGETPTDGYNLLKLFASYSFTTDQVVHTITVRLDNATDALYHNHLNYLKDFAPEMGRNVGVVYSVTF